MTLKPGVGVFQGHSKWHHSIDHIRLSITPPLLLWLYLVLSLSYLTLNDRDLEIWVTGHSRSFKLVLSNWLGVVQGHWKWRRSIDHIRVSTGPPL